MVVAIAYGQPLEQETVDLEGAESANPQGYGGSFLFIDRLLSK